MLTQCCICLLCRTSFRLQDKHLMPFLNVTHTVMGTGKNMQIWRERTATLRKLKRYAKPLRFVLVCMIYINCSFQDSTEGYLSFQVWFTK